MIFSLYCIGAPSRRALPRLACLTACLLLFAILPLSAEVQVIPQVADGGGWSTTIVLSNKTAAAQSVTLRFNRATTNGATETWTPPFLDNPSLPTLNLPAGSSLFLRTPGTAANVSQGWAELDAPSGIVGYAIFTTKTGNSAAQDATAPAVSASSRILVPFDNTSGLISAFAVVNPNAGALVVQVNLRTADGLTSSGNLPSLPGKGQTTFLMPTQFPSTVGKRGLAEFYVNSGSIAIIALRANGAALTSAPAYSQSGQPVIGAPVTNPPAGSPQIQVIPQVADGGGWSTTIVLANTTTSNLQAGLTFRQSTGGGATAGWNPAFLDNISPSNLNIPAGATVFLQTPGTANAVTQGWAELTAPAGLVGYAIFTSRTSGSPQDATAPAVSAASRLLIPFDNTSGLITALALVNPGNNTQTISVNTRTSDGTTSSGTLDLPARGQIAVLMPSQFPGTADKKGLAEFYVSSGSIALIALRASGTAFTSAPAYFESGAPIISSGGGNPGGGGGGGSTPGNTDPTPAEIESWIARGNYSAGIITLTRSTSHQFNDPLPATVTKEDDFSAQFMRVAGADFARYLRGEQPPGLPNITPAVGSCVVYNLTSISNPYPNLTITGLDAGPQITSNGPNGSRAALRQSLPGLGFAYNAESLPNTYLASGRYTLTGPGGADVGSFSGALDIVQDFVVTNNPDDFKVINRSGSVTVRWSGGEPSAIVTISGSSTSLTTAQITTFICLQNASAGQFTVPSSILSQLPASLVIGGFGLRGSFSVTTQGKGARFTTPSGLDILTANNFWDWSYTPQYQ